MPSLPLPEGGSSLAGPFVVTSEDDVRRVWPAALRRKDKAEIREALITSLTAMLLNAQDRDAYAADQANVLRATDDYLRAHGEDRGVIQQEGEDEEAFRARLLAVPALVSPEAILDVVNAIIDRYTPGKTAQYVESIQDRLYLFEGGVGTSAGLIDATPYYPERLYPEDAPINDGYYRRGGSAGKAWLFDSDTEGAGRFFIIRVPDLSSFTLPYRHLYDTPESDADFGSLLMRLAFGNFLGDGDIDQTRSFLYDERGPTSDFPYRLMVAAVEAICGHSIRWELISDSSL